MSSVPWTITYSKRKALSNVPIKWNSQERQVRWGQTSDLRVFESLRVKQQTLTQIEFRSSSSRCFQNDGTHQDSNPTRKDLQQRSRMPKIRKRDSTLTQMDFFQVPNDETSMSADEMLPLEDYRSKSRASIGRKTKNMASTSGSRRSDEDENQEYTPRKRRKLMSTANPVTKRTVKSVKKREQSPLVSRNEFDDKAEAKSCTAQLQAEVKDSQEIEESSLQDADNIALELEPTFSPQTPKRTRRTIPSSQSPESLPRCSLRLQSPVKLWPGRRPLQELSTNKLNGISFDKKSELFHFKSPKIQPGKHRSQVKQNARFLPLDKPQADDSLLHETLSPLQKNSRRSKRVAKKEPQASISDTDVVEIPPTSDASDSLNTNLDLVHAGGRDGEIRQAMLTSITDIGSRKRQRKTEYCNHDQGQNERETMLLDNEIIDMIPEYNQVDSDNESLGDLVANDTQFVRVLDDRTSTPTRLDDNTGSTTRNENESTMEDSLKFAVSFNSQERSRSSPLHSKMVPEQGTERLTPRLVYTSPATKAAKGRSIAQQGLDLSKTIRSRRGKLVSITQVPLNDIVSSKSSSSPRLPAQQTQTQFSIGPASIPHPSQVSTQVSSQQYLITSPGPQRSQFKPVIASSQRITINDSSSEPIPSHRVLSHQRESQLSNWRKFDLVEDSEEDDLDLDAVRNTEENVKKSINASLSSQEDGTQTPTQKTQRIVGRSIKEGKNSDSENHELSSSPIIVHATTRAERDAMLEVLQLSPSQPAIKRSTDDVSVSKASNSHRDASRVSDNDVARFEPILPSTPMLNPILEHDYESQALVIDNATGVQTSPSVHQSPLSDISLHSELSLSPTPKRKQNLKDKYPDLSGFDNDTQSDFTQGGHITAAYVHKKWEEGVLPKDFTPLPFAVPAAARNRKRKIS